MMNDPISEFLKYEKNKGKYTLTLMCINYISSVYSFILRYISIRRMYINWQRNICYLFSQTSQHCALNISNSEQFIPSTKFPISWVKLTPYSGCPRLSRSKWTILQ